MNELRTYTAFAGDRLIASGPLEEMLRRTKTQLDEGVGPVVIFDDQTGKPVDFDFRGTLDEVLEREGPPRPRGGPGRPKLGVVAREVSLLPRHWEWLELQPSGASAALRRLVEEARKHEPDHLRARRAAGAADRFMSVAAGDRPGFEEASRALYAGNRRNFEALIADWPPDLRAHATRLAQDAFPPEDGSAPPPARP